MKQENGMTENLSIEDLEKHSGLSTRTLHYYMSKELLPGPETRGKNASYTQEHLDRLDLILILKELRLSLDEIKALLDQLTPEEICQYRDHQENLLDRIKQNAPGGKGEGQDRQQSSALDYLKGLEEMQSTQKIASEIHESKVAPDMLFQESHTDIFLNNTSIRINLSGDLWRRVVLGDGIELHIRQSGDEQNRYYVDRLIKFARSLMNQKNNFRWENNDE
jgi:DNA-binding transcriptional MerR regulator